MNFFQHFKTQALKLLWLLLFQDHWSQSWKILATIVGSTHATHQVLQQSPAWSLAVWQMTQQHSNWHYFWRTKEWRKCKAGSFVGGIKEANFIAIFFHVLFFTSGFGEQTADQLTVCQHINLHDSAATWCHSPLTHFERGVRVCSDAVLREFLF